LRDEKTVRGDGHAAFSLSTRMSGISRLGPPPEESGRSIGCGLVQVRPIRLFFSGVRPGSQFPLVAIDMILRGHAINACACRTC
jgi:hypothetical protein